MPTQNWVVDSTTYTSKASGAKKFNVQNVQSQAVEYVVAASLPARVVVPRDVAATLAVALAAAARVVAGGAAGAKSMKNACKP